MKRLFSISTLIYVVLGYVVAYYFTVYAPGLDISQTSAKIGYIVAGLVSTLFIKVTCEIIKNDEEW